MPEQLSQNPDRGADEVSTQQLSVLVQRAMGLENAPKFTESQIDEVLSQRRQVFDHIHSDNQRDSWDSKFYLIVILVFILIFAGAVLNWKPDLFSQVLSFLAGIFGGGLGGYGYALKNKN